MFQTRALWSHRQPGLSWLAIIRLGLVQAALGSVVVLTTSTLNRVMVVELSLAAVVPGLLVGLHYAVQLGRPLWGHASDKGGSRTRWILGGLALLAISGTAAAATTLLFEQNFWLGMVAALVAFTFIGFGIGASGTSLLALLASRTAPERRPAAATLVWMMMIAGIVVTAIISSVFLDPYSHLRLVTITAMSGTIAFVVAALGVWGVERRSAEIRDPRETVAATATFREALVEIWHDPAARIFTVFVFVSMLAYQTQDLILEPFAGLLFGHTPGESTALGGMHHAGVFLGMAFVGIAGSLFAARRPGLLKMFTVAGCLGSGIALGFLAVAAGRAPAWPLEANVFALGFANGVFAVAAIGTMMTLAGKGTKSREGVRMGVWGAAQAIAFGLGGFAGTVAIDVTRWLTGDIALSFAVVFTGEALLFLVSAMIATSIGVATASRRHPTRHAPLAPAE
ncbi:MAG: BCD family MFS transporter [Roseitalea sp.]|jgi:BCD family chlorophyll transporter-like MFS transporter|nr:BCD family MFS transporter [Roseitalea sp.]MBO6723423.1 BCD family MFS transporter [Roseitalea sp.]MBO6742110.1 BCD family MFS transporter [Roseitalea sp.]